MRKRDGFVLMLVLWLVAVLAIVCSGIAVTVHKEMAAASDFRGKVSAQYAAESGIAVAAAQIEARMATNQDSALRRDYLNHIPGTNIRLAGADVVTYVQDVGSMIDANMASEESLAKLFAFFTTASNSALYARRIHEHMRFKPLSRIEDMLRISGISVDVIERALPYLTLDGDGYINRNTASDTVMAAAAGALSEEPSRIVIRSHATARADRKQHEIKAVYGIVGEKLALMRWEEN